MKLVLDGSQSRLAPPAGRSQRLAGASRAEFRYAKRLPVTSCINSHAVLQIGIYQYYNLFISLAITATVFPLVSILIVPNA